jgi:hypothetical protein
MRIALTPSTQMDTVKEISKGTGEVALLALQISPILTNPVFSSTIFRSNTERLEFLLNF